VPPRDFGGAWLGWRRPLSVWAAAIRDQRGEVLIPWAILSMFGWVAGRLGEGGRMEVIKGEEDKG